MCCGLLALQIRVTRYGLTNPGYAFTDVTVLGWLTPPTPRGSPGAPTATPVLMFRLCIWRIALCPYPSGSDIFTFGLPIGWQVL